MGAVLQVSGVVILTAVLASLGKTPQDRALAMMLALPPAILPLAISQKPQLMPPAALVTATVLARQARGRLDLMLVFGCAAFAMASKFSFFVAGAVVMIAALWWTSRKREAFAWAGIALAVLLLPILWRNYCLYGDPLSPFLESLKSRPDGEVLRFADYLRDAGEPHTVNGLSRFLAGLIAPHGFSDIQTVLGLGIFCIALSGMSEWTWFAVAGGSAVLVFTVWRGQLAPRYLLEAYFWFAIMVVARPWSRWKSALFYGLAYRPLESR